jgi:hypothetical protein
MLGIRHRELKRNRNPADDFERGRNEPDADGYSG